MDFVNELTNMNVFEQWLNIKDWFLMKVFVDKTQKIFYKI